MSFPVFLDFNRPASDKLKLCIPNRKNPITIKKLKRKYAEFARTFDGKSYDSVLVYYYKPNVAEGYLEFKNAEAEDDIADAMGVAVGEFNDDDEETLAPAPELTATEIQETREYLADIRKGLTIFKDAKPNTPDSS